MSALAIPRNLRAGADDDSGFYGDASLLVAMILVLGLVLWCFVLRCGRRVRLKGGEPTRCGRSRGFARLPSVSRSMSARRRARSQQPSPASKAAAARRARSPPYLASRVVVERGCSNASSSNAAAAASVRAEPSSSRATSGEKVASASPT